MNKYIILMLLVITTLLVKSQVSPGQNGFYNVEVEEFKDYTILSKSSLIDVRTPKEYQEGHIYNAQNIDYFDKSFKVELDKLDKSIPAYVYCRSGGRSAKAMQIMKEMGFTSVYNLKGGFLVWAEVNKK